MVELQPSKLLTWVRFPSPAPFVKIVAPSDVEIKLNSKELSFFVFKKGVMIVKKTLESLMLKRNLKRLSVNY